MNTSSVTIAGKSFPLRNPFEAGMVLTEGQANALNQLRHENVRNNSAKMVKEWTGDEAELFAKVDAYDEVYEFNVRVAGEGREPRDPILAEAKSLAKAAIKAKLDAANQKATAEQINAAVEALLAHPEKGPQFRQVAEQRVAERKKLAAEAANLVNLDDISAPAAAA